MRWRKCFYLLVICLLILLTGCAEKRNVITEPEVPLVWPSAPEEAKIEWVKEYKILEDTVSRKGFWGKIGDFFLGTKTAEITRPYGICSDDNNHLFVADPGAGVIHVFDMEQENYLVIEGYEDTALKSPIGLTYVKGFLYITDSAQGLILQYDMQKEKLRSWGASRLERPTGIAFSQSKQLFYVTDTSGHEVVVIDQLGIEKFRFGGRGVLAGEFNFPTDLG